MCSYKCIMTHMLFISKIFDKYSYEYSRTHRFKTYLNILTAATELKGGQHYSVTEFSDTDLDMAVYSYKTGIIMKKVLRRHSRPPTVRLEYPDKACFEMECKILVKTSTLFK